VGAFNDVWSFPTSPSYRWRALFPTGSLPPARHHGGVIYDPVRDRLVITGGLTANGTPLSDTWALPLDGLHEWVRLPAAGSAPALGACNAVYDALRDRMIVVTQKSTYAVTLTEPSLWSLMDGNPAPGLSLAYDTARDRLVAVGDSLFEPKLWEFPIATHSWSLLESNAPIDGRRTCRDCSVVYQERRDRLVALGFDDMQIEPFQVQPLFETWAIDFGAPPVVCGRGDQVASLSLGAGTWWPEADRVLGEPDGIPLSLGTGGSVVIHLDHPVGDQAGYDLYVHEIGALQGEVDENYQVEVSANGSTFVPIGTSEGGMRGFDLAGSGVLFAPWVRITDLDPPEVADAGTNGADIDAIECVHCSESVAVPPAPVAIATSSIAMVRPNPGSALQAFDLRLAPGGAQALAIYAADGRRVWSRDLRGLGAGAHVVVWDGRGSNGRAVPPSLYFARLEGASGAAAVRRIVRVR